MPGGCRYGWETWVSCSGYPKNAIWWETHGIDARPTCGYCFSLEEAWELCKRRAKRRKSIATLFEFNLDLVKIKIRIDYRNGSARA